MEETGADDNPPPLGIPANWLMASSRPVQTARRKGAMVEERGMVNHLLSKIPALGCPASDVIAQTASQCV